MYRKINKVIIENYTDDNLINRLIQINGINENIATKLVNNDVTLDTLGLSSKDITDTDAETLADMLRVNSVLTIFDISFNEITDTGATSLAETLKVNSVLKGLYINNNKITDTGATSIAEALKVNSSIKFLFLHSNEITDTGATSIAEALRYCNRTITSLTDWGNSISSTLNSEIKGYTTRNKGLSPEERSKQLCFSGCTDPDAINYDENADVDDGTCDIISNLNIYQDSNINDNSILPTNNISLKMDDDDNINIYQN